MLSAKPWKLDAVIRLLLSVFICIYAGSLAAAVMHYAQSGGKAGFKFYPAAAAAFVFLAAALFMSRKGWALENIMKRLMTLLGCFYAGLLLGAWAQQMASPDRSEVPSAGQMVITVLSFQGAALVFIALFLREHRAGWAEAFGFYNRWPRAVLAGIVAACVFLPIGFRLQQLSGQLIGRFSHLKPEEQLPVQTLRGAVSWGDRLMLGVVTILLVPVAEEMLFRGILYPWIKRIGFPRLAVWGTALAFAAMHLNLETLLPLFVLALALIALYEWTDNLLAPISAHALFNALNFALVYWAAGSPGRP
jgi:membrane protease YdiL (CAAX protease family)